ncbi:MAG: tetratricopeptide repeat protein [Bacteroidota bacterium]
MKTSLVSFFSVLLSIPSSAQTSLKIALKKADPLDTATTLTIKEKIRGHQAYLDNAIATKNTTQHFYGLLYLYVDHYKAHDYVGVAKDLLQADSLAKANHNSSWLGGVSMRKGLMSDVIDGKLEDAIAHYKEAIKHCNVAKDSLCIGESLEQISTSYAFLEQYDSAHYYFKLALPCLQKFADKAQMALTYNNYSNLLSFEQKYSEAKIWLDSAIAITKANKNLYKEMMYQNNLASLYTQMRQYDKAAVLYHQNLIINKQNNWADRLQHNYLGLSVLYEVQGDYHKAFDYLKIFYLQKDSLTGAEVQLKIAEINTKYDIQEKELALSSTQLNLVQANASVQKRNIAITSILLFVFMGSIWGWSLFTKKKRKLLHHQENLSILTQLLLQKNSQLTSMELQLDQAIAKEKPLESAVANEDPLENSFSETSLYNQRILTQADWNNFKTHFEKAYPGYLSRLRSAYSTLSEAEERLFLLIKLNLKNAEIADMLGISADSVKKTRTRLRKRLELAPDDQTDDFIRRF